MRHGETTWSCFSQDSLRSPYTSSSIISPLCKDYFQVVLHLAYVLLFILPVLTLTVGLTWRPTAADTSDAVAVRSIRRIASSRLCDAKHQGTASRSRFAVKPSDTRGPLTGIARSCPAPDFVAGSLHACGKGVEH